MEWQSTCLLLAECRTTGWFAVFPTNAVHAAVPSPRRCCWVGPPRNFLDLARVLSPTSCFTRTQFDTFSHSKSFPLGVFVQASLDTGWTQHADHGLWRVFGIFSRQGMAHRSSSACTALCDSTELFSSGQIRLDLSPFMFAQAQVELFRSRISSSSTCSSRCISVSIHAVQQESTHAAFPSLATRSWLEVCSTTFHDCDPEIFGLLVFRHHHAHQHRRLFQRGRCTIPAFTWRTVSSVCTSIHWISSRCPPHVLMAHMSLRCESHTLLAKTARQDLGSSFVACPWTGKSFLSVTLSQMLSGSSAIHSIGTSSQEITLSSRSVNQSSAGLWNQQGSQPWFLQWLVGFSCTSFKPFTSSAHGWETSFPARKHPSFILLL